MSQLKLLAGFAFESSRPRLGTDLHDIKVMVKNIDQPFGVPQQEYRDLLADHEIKATPETPMMLFIDPSNGLVTERHE